jgi:hypothetical protein
LRRPFEVSVEELRDQLDTFVDVTIADLHSEFLFLPKGKGFLDYSGFRDAYEILKRHSKEFIKLTSEIVYSALDEDSRVFCVLRAMLGLTPPEWADLARTELGSKVTQGEARTLDRRCREKSTYIHQLRKRYGGTSSRPKSLQNIEDLVRVAVLFLTNGAPESPDEVIHRLEKFDTSHGLESLQYAARYSVPYAVLLYERYLGRPFASHRDAVSEIIGEVMENAVEERLRKAGISVRRTKRAEKIPDFGQAPDFCVPDEINPAVIIEAKIASDDGTARDKIARILNLVKQRDKHVEEGRDWYEVIACIDGRGFRQRRELMRQLLLDLNGKVFTTATLDQLIAYTNLRKFAAGSEKQ